MCNVFPRIMVVKTNSCTTVFFIFFCRGVITFRSNGCRSLFILMIFILLAKNKNKWDDHCDIVWWVFDLFLSHLFFCFFNVNGGAWWYIYIYRHILEVLVFLVIYIIKMKMYAWFVLTTSPSCEEDQVKPISFLGPNHLFIFYFLFFSLRIQ